MIRCVYIEIRVCHWVMALLYVKRQSRVKETAPSAAANLPVSLCMCDVSVKGVDEVTSWTHMGAASHSDDVSNDCNSAGV